MNTVIVYALNGIEARQTTRGNALTTLADMTGHAKSELRIQHNGWVALWNYRIAGAIVGRIANQVMP